MRRIEKITAPDRAASEKAAEKWNAVAKPLGSFGRLEDAVIKLAGIYASENFSLDKRAAVIMCADNGVVSEGVSQTDSFVTSLVAREIAKGNSGVNCLARVFNAEVFVVDVGMKAHAEGALDMNVAKGSANIAKGPAMSCKEAERAIEAGMDVMRRLSLEGFKIAASGEMGIGNTTTAAAVASTLLCLPPEKTVGRGAGLDRAGLERKTAAVRRALLVNKPDAKDPVGLLAKVGGFDIAAMTGLFLGGAVYRVPVIIDGFISAAAAAVAAKIAPLSKEYMLASHVSREPAAKMLLDLLNLEPVIYADMALGEGTGALMLLPLLDGALEVYDKAHRFDELPMERYVKLC